MAGIYFSQTSVIYFCWRFSCHPYYRGVRNSEVSAKQELTVFYFDCKQTACLNQWQAFSRNTSGQNRLEMFLIRIKVHLISSQYYCCYAILWRAVIKFLDTYICFDLHARNNLVSCFLSKINIPLQCSKLKKKSRLSLFQKPGNQTCEFGCPDESLVSL